MRRKTVLGILTAIAILCPLCACFGTGLGAVCLFSAAEDETAAERFILRFDEDMPESGLNAFSAAWNPDPVSERDRIYVVSVPGEDGEDLLRAEYGDHLVYCCPDLRRTVSSLPTDPELKTSDFFQQIHVPEAWELVEPDPDLTVAVLDTGVFREHEDFEGVRILDGYDAVEKHAGVDKDTSGHGTAVIGIIAASPGNGLGSSGICPGVRILPVRVSSGENAIYSSDFVNGLRYAVDAGARIINLSFGGYSFSAAENDAVQYALSKQCLLIAAAGNDGDETHRGEYCYPASYEGVISVGSCGRNGERSAFSQYNDDVWILAPGEQIPFPAFDEEGGSVYRRANGSSYAAAIVTGIAGLVLSAVDGDVRFGPDEFRSLLASDRIPAVGDGCGVVDALRAVSEANEPQISGVVTGQTYRTKVIVRFNRGTALLDGEPFSDGDTVYQNGVHRLTVTDGETKKTVSFRLSYVPATYSVSRDADSLSVTYRGGTATMDGFPYESGEPVTGQGVHRFVLTDPFGERKTVDLTLNTVPPVLSGAEDGAVYDRPVRISTAGAGKIRLNGGELPAGGILTEDGDYELTLSSANGTEEHTVRFRIERGGKTAGEAPARSDILLCERYGWFGVYGEGTDGLSVRNLGTGEMLRTVGSGRILRAAVAGEKLILLRDGTAEVLDASLPDSDEISASAPCDDFAWADGLLYLLADGFLSVWDPETDERTPVTETGANAILTDGNVLALYRSETGALTGPDGAALGVLPDGSGRPLLYGDLVFDSGTAYEIDRSGETDELRVRFSYLGSALACRSGFLYTTEEVCSVETGELAGHCGMPLTAVLFGESVALVRRTNGQLSVYPSAGELFAPLPESVAVSPEQTSEYLRTYSFYDGSGPDAVLADGDRFCVLFSSARRYVLYEGRTPVGEVRLPFEPGKGAMEGTNAAFLSSDGRLLWESGTLR
ncbi:MAG: S8 family serine peptidase, partial [Clostridia bacterium]|nr:S8 family serine peptidase [Clostridia bacterium]